MTAATVAMFCAGMVATWTIDPTTPGADLPARGRSVFDQVLGDGTIPFPFDKLIAQIEARGGCTNGTPCTRQVLIPLGRSLQRTSAAPDYFQSPRVVAAAVDQGAGLAIRNRLYLGYQPRANLIEVVSYNEAQARFEFQLVRNYAAGGKPEVVYANRTVCTTCHQNQAPIFSQQVWLETNANPRVAELLARHGATRFGTPVRGTLEIANTIDESVARANLFGANQLLWREGCGASDACRAAVFNASLQYLLAGNRGFRRDAPGWSDAVALLASNARKLWPGGLAIPEQSIPNRDPLGFAPTASALAQSHIAAPFEPLRPRPAKGAWPADGATLADQLVIGIAGSLSAANARALDAALAANANSARSETLHADCEVTVSGNTRAFTCGTPAGPLTLEGTLDGTGGTLDTLRIQPEPTLRYYRLAPRSGNGASSVALDVIDRDRPARRTTGARIAGLVFARDLSQVSVTIVDDFAPLKALIERTFASGEMREGIDATTRVAQLRAGLAGAKGCCAEARFASAPRLAAVTGTGYRDVPLGTVLEPYCGSCHRTAETAPPNFLAGDAARVRTALASCASRIVARLSMWDVAADERAKTPMPPANAADAPPIARETVTELRKQVERLSGVGPFTQVAYEDLPRCLPLAAPAH